MKYLVYISTAHKLLNQDELLDILTVSRRNNQERHLTGMLIYGEGTFIQVLEGEEDELKKTYAHILTDTRHKSILKMTEGETGERNFPEWTMGFKSINAAELAQFGSYTNPDDKDFLKNDDNVLFGMMKTFATANRMTDRL